MKLFISLVISNSISVLIISRKKLSVISVNGRVRMNSSGCRMVLVKLRSSVEIISDDVLEKWMLLNNRLVVYRESEVMFY